jgi:hypothetical protein
MRTDYKYINEWAGNEIISRNIINLTPGGNFGRNNNVRAYIIVERFTIITYISIVSQKLLLISGLHLLNWDIINKF